MGYDISAEAFRNIHLATFIGYMLGSIPFGLVLCTLFGLGDIRKIGSGNIGATNVLRTGNRPLALATLVLDGAKGAAAVLVIRYYWGDFAALYAAGGAVIGHILPFWLKFKGGKGVATTLGTLLAVNWIMGLGAIALWLVTAKLGKRSSLAALAAMAGAPVVGVAAGDTGGGWLALILAVIVWIAHYQNIARLLAGTEPKIGEKNPRASDLRPPASDL